MQMTYTYGHDIFILKALHVHEHGAGRGKLWQSAVRKILAVSRALPIIPADGCDRRGALSVILILG